MYSEKIGLWCGFGSYATLDLFKKNIDKFALESERDYPHLFFDKNFTMSSRTRAFLAGKGYNEIVNEIANSIDYMCAQNVKYI